MTTLSAAPSNRCSHCGQRLAFAGQRRRFTLADAMILIAASALAFVMVRPVLNGALIRGPGWARWVAVIVSALITWTPATLLCSLREPRPGLRRMSRRPGFVASLAVLSTLALGALAIAVLTVVRLSRRGMQARLSGAMPGGAVPRTTDPSWWIGVVVHFASFGGAAVLAAWVVLIATGRHRAARDWTDYLGRFLGGVWVAILIFDACARLGHLRD